MPGPQPHASSVCNASTDGLRGHRKQPDNFGHRKCVYKLLDVGLDCSVVPIHDQTVVGLQRGRIRRSRLRMTLPLPSCRAVRCVFFSVILGVRRSLPRSSSLISNLSILKNTTNHVVANGLNHLTFDQKVAKLSQ